VKVSFIGLGYIGLPTAVIASSKIDDVIGIDVNDSIINKINSGKVHIVEPGIEAMLEKAIQKGFKAKKYPEKSDIFVITVPTPIRDDFSPDLSFIESAITSISGLLKKGDLIILESTSPVGTTEKIANQVMSLRPDLKIPFYGEESSSHDIFFAYCPERVLPGHAIDEITNNDRIIGGMTAECSNKARNFYSLFVKGELYLADSRTAELSKLVENSFRDVNIAFANELSLICHKLGVNVWQLINLANKHPRVNILQPGPGVGGHCIAVDPWFIVHSAKEESRLVKTAREVNDFKPNFVLERVNEAIKRINKKTNQISIACLGLAFKKDIDDLRESPAVHIVNEISKLDFKEIFVVEPNISNLPELLMKENITMSNIYDAIDQSSIVLLLVDHNSFVTYDKNLIKDKMVIDTRGIWS